MQTFNTILLPFYRHVTMNIIDLMDCTFLFLLQDFDKPSPPQKPLPADPLGRSSRLGHSATAAGVHVPYTPGPLPIPIPTVPRPPPTIPLPSRWVQRELCLYSPEHCRLHSDMTG